MSASFRKPPEPKGEVRALFPEQAAGPFQSTGGDDTDLDFLRRFGPKDRPVDMRGFVEEPPEAAASALSAPDNFIADGATRRLVRHTFGRRRWPLVLIAAALGGILALGAHRLGLVPFLRPAPERPAPEAARGAPAGDALATATHP
uniref:hypothetical protein n=1 Tax=Methylobacterium segetis TaxID=2488750 RepID=UPI001A9DF3E6